jgi:hypothetical protein
MSAFLYCSFAVLGRTSSEPSCAESRAVPSTRGGCRVGPGRAAAWRRLSYDGKATLACYIASGTDIDDIVPLLTAYQIEWNKLHGRMRGDQVRAFLREPVDNPEGMATLAAGMGIAVEDLEQLRLVWRGSFWEMLRRIASRRIQLAVRLLAGTMNDYRRATFHWFEHVAAAWPTLASRPVYFVSSNTHSLVNLLTGFALRNEQAVLRFVGQPEHADLMAEWREIEARSVPSSRENFLYYVKKLLATPAGARLAAERAKAERDAGIMRIPSEHGFDIQAQAVICVARRNGSTSSASARHRASGGKLGADP